MYIILFNQTHCKEFLQHYIMGTATIKQFIFNFGCLESVSSVGDVTWHKTGASCVCVCVFIKLHITAQPGPGKRIFQCYSMDPLYGGSV